MLDGVSYEACMADWSATTKIEEVRCSKTQHLFFHMKNNGRTKVKNIRFLFFTALIIMTFSTPVLSLETKEELAVPVAEVSAPEFRFESVPEGTKVTHPYVIHNRGSAPLEVLKVKTG